MRRYIVLAITAGLAGISVAVPVAHAESGYGTAGCGLGSILFGSKPGLIQVLAATTNGTFGTQTFGITTGTSNCEDTAGGAQSTKAFVQANREAVSKDIARGSGFAVGGSEGCQFKAGDRVRIEASDMGTITTIKGLNEQSSGSKIAGKGEDR